MFDSVSRMWTLCFAVTGICFSSLWCVAALAQQPNISQRAAGLQRGVNFGNMLEAPYEGAWGLTVQESFFDRVVEAGFNHIRLPVSWTHHASQTSPYTIDPVFMQRVDWAVTQAESRNLKIIVNNHHYDELNNDPVAEKNRALAIWQQIANQFQNRSPKVLFEILNEPHGAFNDQPELWNNFVADALALIRQSNPTRKVLIGPVFWNNIASLPQLQLPQDPNLIATVHYYDPFAFTHQGAGWVNPIPPVGTTWNGDRFSIGSPWQNWSWDTTVTPTTSGVTITYDQGWAGFYAHTNSPVESAHSLIINVDKALNLNISVGNGTDNQTYSLQTTDGPQDYTIKLNSSIQSVSDVFLQNHTPNPVQAFNLSKMQLVGKRVHQLVKTERQAVADAFSTAATWARARNIPMYLGEFGTYEQADLDSRIAWTQAVRIEAHRSNIGFGYWELAAGFGIFDPVNNEWRVPLVRALIPGFEK